MSADLRTVAIGSLGAIGTRVARGILDDLPGLRLVAVSARDRGKAAGTLEAMGSAAHVVPVERLADEADIVVECAPVAIFPAIAGPAIEKARTLIPASVAGLLFHPGLVGRASETGARIVVPTGAIAGLDAVRAARHGRIESVTLVTRKPPAGLAGAPGLAGTGFDPAALDKPLKVFDGNTLDAARAFPANVNVAAALALAGIGPERTRVEIWADPAATRNVHRIRLESDSANFDFTIDVLPSADNPKTSALTPLSILAALESLSSDLRIGS